MELSKQTMSILQYCAKVNQQIVIPAGNHISTINKHGTMMMSATVPEHFTNEVRFGDLNEFFRMASIFENPQFEFGKDEVMIYDNSGCKQVFPYPRREDLIFEERRPPEVPPVVTFPLSGQQIKTIRNALSINKVEDIQFLSQVDSDGEILIHVHKKDRINKQFTINVSSITGLKSPKGYNIYLQHKKDAKKGARFDLMELDYQVSIVKLGYPSIKFSHEHTDQYGNNYKVEYLMAGAFGSTIVE